MYTHLNIDKIVKVMKCRQVKQITPFSLEDKYLHVSWEALTNITVFKLSHSFDSSYWEDLHKVLVVLFGFRAASVHRVVMWSYAC